MLHVYLILSASESLVATLDELWNRHCGKTTSQLHHIKLYLSESVLSLKYEADLPNWKDLNWSDEV